MSEFRWRLSQYVQEWVSSIPFHCIRDWYWKRKLKYIGNPVEICRNVEIRCPWRVIIRSNSSINKNVLIDARGGTVEVGQCVDIAQETNIWTLQHDYNDKDYKAYGKPVVIEDYVWLASRVTVLPGVRIKKGAVVASGSIVTKDVEEYTVVAGIPAKKIGERSKDLSYSLGKKRWFS